MKEAVVRWQICNFKLFNLNSILQVFALDIALFSYEIFISENEIERQLNIFNELNETTLRITIHHSHSQLEFEIPVACVLT